MSGFLTTTYAGLPVWMVLVVGLPRPVIVLRYYDDLAEAQAAEVLGIAVGTVKSQTHAGLARLRSLLPADEAPVA